MKGFRISLVFKALRELGPRQLGLFALYRLGLTTGYFRWRTGDGRLKTGEFRHRSSVIGPLLDLPDPDPLHTLIGPEGLATLKAEADEIVEGRLRLFGGQPVPLVLTPPEELSHWTDYALGKSAFPNLADTQSANFPLTDIKFIWEPARFGWAFTLGRAYHLTDDGRYPEAFWRFFEMFHQTNPVNMGPNWESAQEVALRLIAFTFAAQIFASSPHSTVDRQSSLAQSIADHAARIPSTLIYARAQNNNHLLSEAAGLITASLALPEHPEALRWSRLGWSWFESGLQSQIAEDGSFIQQSTNYHRMMLQLALWVVQMQKAECGMQNSKSANEQRSKWAGLQPLIPKLQTATRWLLALADSDSGRAPNLGPNDGAYILPLTTLPFTDYRSVLQAASCAFLGQPAFAPGPWDEMSLWLSVGQPHEFGCQLSQDTDHRSPNIHPNSQAYSPTILRASKSWAYLRVAQFSGRPGHADQLHLDLWWRGLNITQDAGTYLYNAAPLWDNALTHTAVHNTVMINGQEQMTRAGRFLYLDRAQAEVLEVQRDQEGSWEQIVACHYGYLSMGIRHIRTVTAYQDDRWVVKDRLQPLTDDVQPVARVLRLHWLLPDWPSEMQNAECGLQNSKFGLRIASPKGEITLDVWVDAEKASRLEICSLQIIRAGELLHGSGPYSPTWGWVSPTYGVKIPALSLTLTAVGSLPLTLVSEWRFPHG